jgi:hypothetical protein
MIPLSFPVRSFYTRSILSHTSDLGYWTLLIVGKVSLTAQLYV